MKERNKKDNDTYYGDLPSNYLVNLGKEALKNKQAHEIHPVSEKFHGNSIE